MRIDFHLHTSRYSRCSAIPAEKLISQAIKAGLDGVVITEHHHVWPQREIDALKDASDAEHFLLLAAFEYTSACGDILIYGLTPNQAKSFVPGWPPREAIVRAKELGAACIAAHPTRAGMTFDESIAEMPLDGVEVCSVNLAPHERRLAQRLSQAIDVAPTASSDAHRLSDVGAYATEFDGPVTSIGDFVDAVKSGRFHLP